MSKPTIFILSMSILPIVAPALYGMLGSAGFYVHEISQDPTSFNWRSFFVYCFLGVVVGLMVHNIMIDIFGNSYAGVLIAAGFSVRRITDVADKYLELGLKLPKKN